MRSRIVLFISFTALMCAPSSHTLEAVLPPDILFSAGAQASQVFTFIGVSLLAAFGVFGLYLQNSLNFFRSRVGLMTVGITLCIGALGYGLYTQRVPKPSVDIRRAYESVRLIIIKQEHEDPFVLELDLNSRENPDGTFDHYYFAEMINGTEVSHAYTTFTHNTKTLVPFDYLTEFSMSPVSDLSARESLALSATIADTTITIAPSEITSDFLTKNTQEYTKYIGVGTTTVTVSGHSFPAHVFISPAYSSDYSKYIFTEDYESIVGSARQFVLWDILGNFYLVDQSLIENPTSAYPSHVWTLHKNARTGAAYKGYSGNIAGDHNDILREANWRLTTYTPPIFSAEIYRVTPYEGNLPGMLVKGFVTTSDRERIPVIGTGYVEKL